MNNEELNINELSEEMLAEVSGGASTITVTANEVANIRSGPGKKYLIIGKTIPGHTAKFMGVMKQDDEGRTWIKVSWSGNVGWVQAKFCTMNKK